MSAGAHPSKAPPPREAHSRTHSSIIQREDVQRPRLQRRYSQQFHSSPQRRETRGGKSDSSVKDRWGQGVDLQCHDTLGTKSPCPGLRSRPQQHHPQPPPPRPGPGAHSPFCAGENSLPFPFWETDAGVEQAVAGALSCPCWRQGSIFISRGVISASRGPGLLSGTPLLCWGETAPLSSSSPDVHPALPLCGRGGGRRGQRHLPGEPHSVPTNQRLMSLKCRPRSTHTAPRQGLGARSTRTRPPFPLGEQQTAAR